MAKWTTRTRKSPVSAVELNGAYCHRRWYRHSALLRLRERQALPGFPGNLNGRMGETDAKEQSAERLRSEGKSDQDTSALSRCVRHPAFISAGIPSKSFLVFDVLTYR